MSPSAVRAPPMRVLITGGCGFVGSHLARALVRRGHRVALYDALLCFTPQSARRRPEVLARAEGLERAGCRVFRDDVRDPTALRHALHAARPEVVVHLAAVPSPAAVAAHPRDAVTVNEVGTEMTLEAASRAHSVRRVVFVSSSYVYGEFSGVADETHPTRPMELYGRGKCAGERTVRAWTERYGLEHVIARPTAAYGLGDLHGRVVSALLKAALDGRPMTLHDGGSAVADFTAVSDLVDGLVRCVERPCAAGETFNLSRGEARSVRELAERVRALVPGASIRSTPPDVARPRRGALCCDRARKILGFSPAVSLEQGLAAMYAAAHVIDCISGAA